MPPHLTVIPGQGPVSRQDETPEQKLDRVIETIMQMALDEGMTIAVSASVRTGKPQAEGYYNRCSAQSNESGDNGGRLVLNAMRLMIGYYRRLTGGTP